MNLKTLKNRFKIMSLPSFPAAHLLALWGGLQNGFNAFAINPSEHAHAVKCPTLFFHGELDRRVSTEEAKNFFKNLSGKKYFILYPDIGHELMIANKKEWKRDISNFLNGF